MRILTVVGARPQFVKVAPVSRALARESAHTEVLVHTGQHFDAGMSDVFFEELGIATPDHHLGVAGGSQAEMVARMLVALERVMLAVRPDLVLIYGDTNSTLAGALAAAKLSVRIAHVEAGLRSFDRRMPEEINRLLADRIASMLFCPSDVAVRNLADEGITSGVHQVGDVMLDALNAMLPRARARSGDVHARRGTVPGEYVLATLHRAGNTDDPVRLRAIVGALGRLEEAVVLPLHPRTRSALTTHGITTAANIRVIEPVGYLEMLGLCGDARVIVTDSGGLQKEAYWLGVPCVTTRDSTEWVETVAAGWNTLVDADATRLTEAVQRSTPTGARTPIYGDGHAADAIVAAISLDQQ